MKTLAEKRSRLEEISNEIDGIDVTNVTPDQIERVDALNEEFETITKEIETLEKLENIKKRSTTSQRQTAATPVTNTPRVEVNNIVDFKRGQFKNAGEFYMAVKNKDMDKLKNTAFEKYGEDGGFLIPEDFRGDIQKKVDSDESLLSLCRRLDTSSNHITLPTNESAAHDGSGIIAYWEGEDDVHTGSKSKFGTYSQRLSKLTAYVKATDEILEDASLLESWIRSEAPDAINYKINAAILAGSGVGMPDGVAGSAFGVTVAKEAGQTAALVYENLVKMNAALLGEGVWVANVAFKENLGLLEDSAGQPIYMNGAAFPNMQAKPFDTLLGKRIIYLLGGPEAMGTEGDIRLLNLKYYIAAMKVGGVKSQVSTHVHFDRDVTAFKFSLRMAGGCPYKSPVTAEKGGYQMSGFVSLADRP